MPQLRSLRILWVALIPVLVLPLYGQDSCTPCPAPPNPCQRYAWVVQTNECTLTDLSGNFCDYEGGTGICSEGQCLPSECAGVASYGICDDPVSGGLVGACVEDVCVLAAPEDQCVKVGVGRINCCSQEGCSVANGAYCNDPLDGVSCDPSGIEPPGQPGQDGICDNGTCVAQSGLCAGVACPSDVSDPCARDYCNPQTGQCDEWIVDTFTECLVAGAPGLCAGGTCEQIEGGECDGSPCETSSSCKVAACRLPCTYSELPCTSYDYQTQTPSCYIDNLPDGTPCRGEPGTCFNGQCAFGGCDDDDDCNDGNPCTENYCDPFGRLCDTSGAVPRADGTPCAQNQQGQVLALCENGVCLPDLCIGRDCSDGNSCTQDLCDSPYGICSNPNEPDGTTCVNGGQCQGGSCLPVIPRCQRDSDCDDGNSCTEDTCPATLCEFDPLPNGTPCDGNGQCLLGSCLSFGF